MVVHRKALDILAENDLGLVFTIGADPQRIEEERATGATFEVVFEAHFRASDAESLAGEPR